MINDTLGIDNSFIHFIFYFRNVFTNNIFTGISDQQLREKSVGAYHGEQDACCVATIPKLFEKA